MVHLLPERTGEERPTFHFLGPLRVLKCGDRWFHPGSHPSPAPTLFAEENIRPLRRGGRVSRLAGGRADWDGKSDTKGVHPMLRPRGKAKRKPGSGDCFQEQYTKTREEKWVMLIPRSCWKSV